MTPEKPTLRTFAVGDRVFVLRWLLNGTQEGPFPITEVTGPGRYVVRYGSHASYAADAGAHELVRATPAVIEQLSGLMRELQAKHRTIDDTFAARLRALGETTAEQER